MIEVFNQIPNLAAGIVTARGVTVAPSPDRFASELAALVERRQAEDFPPENLKSAVRALLRTEHFKPSGRSKPASEYLAQAARENRFPFINNLVDINNYISLLGGLPVSLLDLDVVGEKLFIRYGREGESYVFNSSGQEIGLHGVICVCSAADKPLGTPVKDSMAGKVSASTSSVVGIIFAPKSMGESGAIDEFTARFADLLRTYTAAAVQHLVTFE